MGNGDTFGEESLVAAAGDTDGGNGAAAAAAATEVTALTDLVAFLLPRDIAMKFLEGG
jgi:hypothetical protein